MKPEIIVYHVYPYIPNIYKNAYYIISTQYDYNYNYEIYLQYFNFVCQHEFLFSLLTYNVV